jgi:hypothetical protein
MLDSLVGHLKNARDFILSGEAGDENVKGKSKPNFVIFVQV